MSEKKRLSAEDWKNIRKMVCAGETLQTVSKRYGITPSTISNASMRENWPTPMRLRRLQSAEMSQERPKTAHYETRQSRNAPEIVPQTPISATLSQSIQELSAAPPELFQEKLGQLMQGLIAEGLPNIQPPRNINELKTYAEIWRKCSGLDAKAGDGGKAPLITPMRTVTRRRDPVVDVGEVVPEKPHEPEE